MSRTNRKYWTDRNRREARKGGHRYRAVRDAIWDADPTGQFTLVGNWAPRGNPHGGMLMSASNTGMWDDERDQGDHRTPRAVKRGERQRVLKDAWDEASAP